MNFLIESDYSAQIRKEVLDVVVNDASVRQEAELAAEAEVDSYLNSRYNTAIIFRKPTPWDPAVEYDFNKLVILQAADFDVAAAYAVEDLIAFEGDIWKANAITAAGESPTTDPGKWDKIGLIDAFYTSLKTDFFTKGTAYPLGHFVEYKSVRYEAILATDGTQLPTNTQYWTLNSATTPPGTLPTNVTFYTAGDSRHPLIKRHLIDITVFQLHKRINPRNIPDLRADANDDAISYLKMVADPRKNIHLDLPLKDFPENEDNVLIHGTNTKLDHGQESY